MDARAYLDILLSPKSHLNAKISKLLNHLVFLLLHRCEEGRYFERPDYSFDAAKRLVLSKLRDGESPPLMVKTRGYVIPREALANCHFLLCHFVKKLAAATDSDSEKAEKLLDELGVCFRRMVLAAKADSLAKALAAATPTEPLNAEPQNAKPLNAEPIRKRRREVLDLQIHTVAFLPLKRARHPQSN